MRGQGKAASEAATIGWEKRHGCFNDLKRGDQYNWLQKRLFGRVCKHTHTHTGNTALNTGSQDVIAKNKPRKGGST